MHLAPTNFRIREQRHRHSAFLGGSWDGGRGCCSSSPFPIAEEEEEGHDPFALGTPIGKLSSEMGSFFKRVVGGVGKIRSFLGFEGEGLEWKKTKKKR